MVRAMADPDQNVRPFSDEEYRARARRVRDEMARREVEVLLVLSPPNVYYLTGFESIWYPPRAPVGVLVAHDDDTIVFVDYERHRTLVERVAHFDDAVFYDYDTAVESLAGYVRPGRTELEIAAYLHMAMAAQGGEEAAIRTMVSSGPDVWCRTHSPATRRRVEAGDAMYVDACGVYNRYHVDLC